MFGLGFIRKKKLIKFFAEELAYLQIRADWWYYCYKRDAIEFEIARQDMALEQLGFVSELRSICYGLGILKEVYEEAYKIYDFRNSGKTGHKADVKQIEKLNKEFCEPRKNKRLIF